MSALFAIAILFAAPTKVPASISQLQGWHGVELRRGGGGSAPWCDIVFPAAFGESDPDEKRVLLLLAGARSGTPLKLDGKCSVPVRMKNALAQLRHLAVERQSKDAALALFGAERANGLDLGGGEVAEVFTAEFLVPTLLGYKALNDILTPDLQQHIARRVAVAGCTEMDQGVDADATAKALLDRGHASLAKAIRAKCTEFEQDL